MTNVRDESDSERAESAFADLVAHAFAFLQDFGFVCAHRAPTRVCYERGSLTLNLYHGRQSFEIGLDIGHANERFSMSQLMRVVDPAAAADYRNFAATTPEALANGVARLAQLVRRYGERALRDDPDFFDQLRRTRAAWSEAYAVAVVAGQNRLRAAAAFREGKYREAVELYEQFEPLLTEAERVKLALARKRS